jgi:hypothetical protein
MDITFCPGFHLPDHDQTLKLYRDLGATSVQLYIDWKTVEPSPGQYDWSAYDRDAEALAAHDLKLGPFVICGSWYVTPDYVRDEPGMVMYRCVEHDRDTAMPSLWCPNIRPHIERFLHALAAHFGPDGNLGFVLLGPTGDYGEALYPIVGNGPGAYHGHPGHWCNDALAVADFQRWLAERYGDRLDALNQSWYSHHQRFDDVHPFTRAHAPSEKAYVEQIRWYRDSMTGFCDFWLATAQSAFQELQSGVPVYLCTGGLMLPEHGSDFSAQASISATYDAGIRVTNEASDYVSNFMLTRLVNAAARGYGTFASHEPASIVTPKGVVGRVFNAVSSGCAQLFSYPNAYIEAHPAGGEITPGGDTFKQLRGLLRDRKPIVPVALFYPDTDRVLRGDVTFDRFHTALRGLVDFDLVDENMIGDGLLDQFSYLVIAGADHMNASTIEDIAAWVEEGGVLLNINTVLADLDEKTDAWRNLIGFTLDSERHYGVIEQAILQSELLPRYQELLPLWATACYGPLPEDCTPLVGVQGGWNPAIANYGRVAWTRKPGDGVVVSYYGLIDPRSGHGGWAASDVAALTFLTDVFEHAQALGFPGTTPSTLRPEMDGVYLTQFGDGMLVLNFTDHSIETHIRGQAVSLSPNSITER